jgi:hypothetical protein
VILRPGEVSRAVTFKQELGRVQFPRNIFLAKIRRKIRFFVRRFRFQRFKHGFLDIFLSILHQVAAKTFDPLVSALYLKYLTNLNVPMKISLLNSQKNKV